MSAGIIGLISAVDNFDPRATLRCALTPSTRFAARFSIVFEDSMALLPINENVQSRFRPRLNPRSRSCIAPLRRRKSQRNSGSRRPSISRPCST